jgi:hypothetical protein
MSAPLLHQQIEPLLANLEKLTCNENGVVEIGWLALSRMVSELRLIIDLASAQDLEVQALRILERDRLGKLDLEAVATETMARLGRHDVPMKAGNVIELMRPANQPPKGGDA